MEEHKRHHYVPVCYLKQFTYEKGSITHIYDKKTDKIFPQNIKDICCKDYFYRLSNEYLESQNEDLLKFLSPSEFLYDTYELNDARVIGLFKDGK